VNLPDLLSKLLPSPSAEAVWELRAELLGGGVDPSAEVFELLREFHLYLDRLETGTASRDHSDRASKMEVGSLSGVVLADLAEAGDAGEWSRRLLSAVLTEGLAVAATRQHVRAWQGELASVHREAAWFLYQRLWTWAERRKPGLEPEERRRLLDQLMAPVTENGAGAAQQTVLLTSLFLLLLVDEMAGGGVETG
jgi:hypothetical protein